MWCFGQLLQTTYKCKGPLPPIFLPFYIIFLSSLWSIVFASVCGREPSAVDQDILSAAADLSACPQFRIAVLNGVGHHYEVLNGLLHILRPYENRTDVFYHPGDGIWDILSHFKFNYHNVGEEIINRLAKDRPMYDLAILVTPEGEGLIAELLHHMRRRFTVMYIHNSDYGPLPRLLSMAESGGSRVQLLALAPHAAKTLAEFSGRPVEWVLATYPYDPANSCMKVPEAEATQTCLRGFSIQGKFQLGRRNYPALWQQIQQRKQELDSGTLASRFHLNILGMGDDTSLGIPGDITPKISMLKQLQFCDYYETIHHSLALVPMFASNRYLTHKFSSTVLTSIITGTPIIANRALLNAYTMFSEQSVYLQRDGESEMDAMMRILSMTPQEVVQVRRGLEAVRKNINVRAALYYSAVIKEVCGGGNPGGATSQTAARQA